MKGEKHTATPNLIVYRKPELVHSYVISGDPAEGNPTSDDSAAHIFDANTLEEVGVMVGKYEPLMFATYLLTLSEMYNDAKIMVERNNHGHAVIATIREKDKADLLMRGIDGKYGWQSTAKSKAHLYDEGTKLFKDGSCTIHTQSTFMQLSNIEGSTLKAPEGDFDDEAVSCMLGIVAGATEPYKVFGHRYASTSNRRTNSPHRHNTKLNARRRRYPLGSIS
jgi:hypothetical protein